MELNAICLLLITLVTAVILVYSLKPSAGSKKQQPPGPRRLPFIGKVLQLKSSQPYVALRDLARKHGPVMYLRLGQIDAVVISSPGAAQEVLREKDLKFASRPKLLVPETIVYGGMDVGFAPYGAYWRTIRKLCITELGGTLCLIREIGDASRRGKPLNLREMVQSCSSVIAGKAGFGRLCDLGDVLEIFDLIVQYSAGITASDLSPSLRFLDVVTGLRRRLWRTHRQLDAILERKIAAPGGG